jgi:hypothetical protein
MAQRLRSEAQLRRFCATDETGSGRF